VRRTLAPKQFGCSASSMSSSEERSIPDAAPLPCQHLPCETKIVDSREVVDHDGDGGSIEDLLEETEDRLSVITHGESEVALEISSTGSYLEPQRTRADDNRVGSSSLGSLLGELNGGSSGSAWTSASSRKMRRIELTSGTNKQRCILETIAVKSLSGGLDSCFSLRLG
jgi:hypothetical protein